MKAPLTFPGAMSLIPSIGYGSLMLFAALAYVQVGHWPMYARPDPKDVGPLFFGEFALFVVALLLCVSPAALAALFWTASQRALRAPTASERLRSGFAMLRQLSVFALGLMLFATELLRLRDWLLD